MTKRAACAMVDLTTTESMASKYARHAVSPATASLSAKTPSRPFLTDNDDDSVTLQAKPAARSMKDPPVVHFIDDDNDGNNKKQKISSDSVGSSVDWSLGPPIQNPFEGMEAEECDVILAKHLPQQEGHFSFSFQPVSDSSNPVAHMPPNESTGATSWDEVMARRLIDEWNQQEAQMKVSLTGKVLELVKGVLQIEEELTETFPDVAGHMKCVAYDTMMYMAETTLKERQRMEAQGKPVWMDIGYHFTRPENMVHIRNGGLLTRKDRNARGIATAFNGAVMGDGIYTANNTSHASYGDTGLLVARLKGVVSSQRRALSTSGANSVPHDTYARRDIVVLRRSPQCLVLLEFERSFLQDQTKAQAIWAAHAKLQRLLDQCLNGGVQSTVWTWHQAYKPPGSTAGATDTDATAIGRKGSANESPKASATTTGPLD